MSFLSEFKCQKCQTCDESKFTKTSKNICKECKKSLKPCKCKNCGDEDKNNFFEGRYTTCKKCKNNVRNDKNLEKRVDKIPYDYESDIKMEKFIANDLKIFRGYTVKQTIEKLQEEILIMKIKLFHKHLI